MDFIKDIKEKTILVVPSSIKNKVLEYINNLDTLVQFKMYSLEEIKKYVYFDYDIESILYLMEEYDYVYEVAKEYIENLYYIEDKDYKEEKLQFLVQLKKKLDNKGLLKYNDLFVKSYKNTPFIVFGYPYLSNFDKKVLSRFNYKFVEQESIKDSIDVYKFDTLEDEVLFVINKIIELLNNKVDINNIYLVNLDNDYNKEITKLFKLFNIPVDIDISSNIMTTVFGKKTFEKLKETKSLSLTLEYMNTFDLSNSYNQSLFSTILNILNKYNDLDYEIDTVISAIEYEFLNKSINNNNYSNMVRVGTLSSYYDENDYVFLLGFNQGSVPRVFKDEDYLSDKIKVSLGLNDVNELNKYENESTLRNIKSIKNLIISYKNQYLDNEYYPSNYLNEEMFNVIEEASFNTLYSEDYSKLTLGMMLDNLIKYDVYDEKLETYYNSLDIDFMKYDNKFKGLDVKALHKYIDNPLKLSYTTIETFYKCQFQYYLSNILKIDKYESSFDAVLGSLFHFVLSHVYKDNFNLDKDYEYYMKDKEFTSKEKFYLDKLKDELRIVCNRLREFYDDTELKEIFTEKKLEIEKPGDIDVIYKGTVDKIMYKEYPDKTLFAIIDYKTGKAEVDLRKANDGLGMQLIVYLYLISRTNLFENPACVGFYLQKLLAEDIATQEDEDYLEKKYDSLKLVGYSNSDIDKISKFDKTFDDSKYIYGLKTTKTGLTTTKTLDDETMDKLVNLVERKFDEAKDKVLNGDFEINPKYVSGEADILGCRYCNYRDICFRKNEDIKDLEKYKDLSFLEEGDNNGR